MEGASLFKREPSQVAGKTSNLHAQKGEENTSKLGRCIGRALLVSPQKFPDQPIHSLVHQADIGLEEIEHGGSGSEFIDGVAPSLSKKQVDPVPFGFRSRRTKAALFLPPQNQGFSQGPLSRLIRQAGVQEGPYGGNKGAILSSPNISLRRLRS